MGLYCSFTPEELGYPDFLEQSFMGATIVVEVDYGPALDAFCETFLSIADDLVPVDTGFLQSTLESDNDGWEAYAEASAEYAQYPEYGTWCQDAQPYFTPAVQEGLQAFIELAGEALSEADQILQDELDAMIEAFTAEAEGMMDFLGGLAMAAIAYVILFPILVYAYGIIDTLTGNNVRSNITSAGSSGMIDIIIT